MGYAIKFGRNAIYNLIGILISVVSSLIITAILARGLNKFEFGLIPLGVSLSGIFAIFSLGIPSTLPKYTSEYFTKKNELMLQKTYLAAYSILSSIGLLIFLVLILFSGSIVEFFHVPNIFFQQAQLTIKIVAISFLLAPLGIILSSILSGLQRFDLLNIARILSSTINVACIYLILQLSLGFKFLIAFVFILSTVIVLGINFWMCYKVHLLPFSYLGFSKPRKDVFKMLFSLSFSAFIVYNLAGFANSGLDSILVASYMPIEYVGYYSIATKLANIPLMLVGLFATAGVPLISELYSKDDNSNIKIIYTRYIKYLCILLIPAFAGLYILSPTIISLWVGSSFLAALSAFRILLVGYMLLALSSACSMVLLGIGNLSKAAMFSILAILLNIILGISLIPRFGLIGAAFMVTIPQIIIQPFIHHIVIKKFSIKWSDLSISTLSKVAVSTIIISIILYLFPCVNVFQLFLSIICSVLLYFVIFYVLGGFDTYDINLLRKLMSFRAR